MTDSRKTILAKYLYPTEKIAEFMFKDVYIELDKIIPRDICISSKNKNKQTRQNNLLVVSNLISQFIKQNQDYAKTLMDLYSHNNIDFIIDDVMIGYIFYLSISKFKDSEPDILRDDRCVTYAPISSIEIL